MNDFPKSQDEYNERYMAPPPEQTFKTIRYCKKCGSVANWLTTLEFNSWYDCDCSIIIGEDEIEPVYQCSLCLEEHETEECNCYNK